jgi:hypothetical protein
MPPPRIMYIENKSSENTSVPGLVGMARIGRVTFSKTGRPFTTIEKACKVSMGLDLKPILMTPKVQKGMGFLVQRRTVLMDFTGRARHL